MAYGLSGQLFFFLSLYVGHIFGFLCQKLRCQFLIPAQYFAYSSLLQRAISDNA